MNIAERHEELCSILLGKKFRNRHMMVIGTIVDVEIERDEYYNKVYFYAVLDNGNRINTIKMKGANHV